MFNRQLIDYLPPILQGVADLKAITEAQQDTIADAWEALDVIMADQFIDSATEDGLAVWESELNITPLASDTLEQRRARIQAAWLYGAVYTYTWLVNWLRDACGNSVPVPTIEGYTLHVIIPVSVDYDRLIYDMRRSVPANIKIEPKIKLSSPKMQHYTGMAIWWHLAQTIKSESWTPPNEEEDDE